MDESTPTKANKHARLRWMQLAVTLAAFAYLFSLVDFDQLSSAFVRVSTGSWLLAGLLTALSLGCGLLRWRLLFIAFGAVRVPALSRLARHYAAGYFYNTYLPGGVSGDFVRGLASARAFEPGSVGGFATVFVERAFGLCALLGLTLVVTLIHPLPALEQTWLPASLGLCGVVGLTGMVFCAHRLAPHAPAPLARVLCRVPAPSAYLPLLAAFVLSIGTQLAPALCGHVLVRAIAPQVRLADSLVIVPLAAAAAFLPISVSGAGVREGVFVGLYALVGVPAGAALAASLSMWLVQAALAALGGIYTLVGLGAGLPHAG